MNILDLNENELERISQIMKAVAHPTRMRILCLLRGGATNVNDLVGLLGINQALVSQQLRILRLNGLVTTARHDGFVFYSLDPEKKKYIDRMMGCICNF